MKDLARILVLILGLLPWTVLADVYPSKPLRLIIPFPVGGSSDILGREIAHHLGPFWGQPIAVENVGGANGVLGSMALVKARPDGYTLMFHIVTSHVTNPWVYRQLPYDISRDFTSITLIGSSSLIFVAHPSFRGSSIGDLVNLAKLRPNAIPVGSFGSASMGHIAVALLERMAGIDILHVPYSGSGPAVLDTLKDQVPVSVVALPAALPLIRQGRLRPLAVTTTNGSRLLDGVPPVAQSTGLGGYDLSLMYGFFAPAGTPVPLVYQVREAVASVLSSPHVQRRLNEGGIDQIIASKPEEMDAYIRHEMRKVEGLVRAAGVEPE